MWLVRVNLYLNIEVSYDDYDGRRIVNEVFNV